MLKRERTSSILGTDSLSFLDDEWDSAMLGYAEKGNYKGDVSMSACYGYQAMKAVARDMGMDVETMFYSLDTAGAHPDVLIVHKRGQRAMKELMAQKVLPRWESLDRAVIGIGYIGWKISGLVYSKPACVNILAENQASSGDDSAMAGIGSALRLLDDTIVPVGLGELSPWFVTPVSK